MENLKKRLVEIQPFLRGFAIRLAGNGVESEELLSEANLRILERLSLYKEGNFNAWAATVMRNLFFNTCKTANRTEYVGIDESGAFPEKQTEINSIDLKMIADVLSSLGEELKLMAQGYKYSEIAEKLNKPLGTVKSMICLHRRVAKRKIKALGY